MRAIRDFVKATLVGGILFVAPLVVVLLLAREAVRLSAEVFRPVTRLVPVEKVGGVVVEDLLAAAVLVCLARYSDRIWRDG